MPAGFLFSIGSDNEKLLQKTLAEYVHLGIYATWMSTNWNLATESTLGDYINIRPGDNLYFFGKRTIYGIGKVLASSSNGDAAFEYYQGSTSTSFSPSPSFTIAWGKDKRRCARWGIRFEPDPHFFTQGIDMDDLLESDPDAFSSLRVFWKRSFIQLDHRENHAFKSALLRVNEPIIYRDPIAPEDEFLSTPCEASINIERSFPKEDGLFTPIRLEQLRMQKRLPDGCLSSEMVVEISILDALKHREPSATKVFGTWDYLTHQKPASPFKPVDYMDRIDIFGYRWMKGFESEQIISKFLVIEVKKGPANMSDKSASRDYNQLMKYVDWVCHNYAYGDYSMIEAFLVASSFDTSNALAMPGAITRSYIKGKNARAQEWSEMHLITYSVGQDGSIVFEEA